MAYARRQRANLDIWPGFVDALASLLMVIIFLLMIFVSPSFI
jgi:chemotaxis protein MotB